MKLNANFKESSSRQHQNCNFNMLSCFQSCSCCCCCCWPRLWILVAMLNISFLFL